jgi:hypothetical protein
MERRFQRPAADPPADPRSSADIDAPERREAASSAVYSSQVRRQFSILDRSRDMATSYR